MDYIKSFIIGSAFPVYLIFFIIYFQIPYDKKKISNEQYAFIVPLYFGLMNMISLYIGKKYKIKLDERLVITSIISIILVGSVATINKIYPYDYNEWIKYYLRISIVHLIVFNFIIYYMEKLFQ